jgi:hypothetical protein
VMNLGGPERSKNVALTGDEFLVGRRDRPVIASRPRYSFAEVNARASAPHSVPTLASRLTSSPS